MAILLDGIKASAFYLNEIARATEDLLRENNIAPPHLAIVILGEDARSMAYVKEKIKACAALKFDHTLLALSADTTEQELLTHIRALNENLAVSGIIVQLPLPAHINDKRVIESILPTKDVDGFSVESVGKLVLQIPTFVSATPLGILMLMDYYRLYPQGKRVVVLGRSHIVGRPLSILLSQNHRLGNGAVTLCHSHISSIEGYTREADILVVAIGKDRFIGPEMIKTGAAIIDVGINSVFSEEKNKYVLKGDVDFEGVMDKAGAITPVPGGVGRMTIAALMYNTLKAHHAQHHINHNRSIFSYEKNS